MSRTSSIRTHAFTLVELLIVILILGILASVVIANLSSATESARQAAFITSGSRFADQAAYFLLKTGSPLPDGSSGELPPGFEAFIDPDDWTGGTPIGGVWDAESFDTGGYASAVGVHFNSSPSKDDAYMTEVDAQFDDGNLGTGGFRKIAADRYYFIVAE